MRNIYDVSLLGELDENGKLKEIWDSDAIKNAIISWLTSYNSDFLRAPNKGGYLTNWLYKPMSDSTVEVMRDSIEDGFDQEFNFVDLVNLDIKPNYENNYWEIYIEVYIPFLDDKTDLTVSVKNLI